MRPRLKKGIIFCVVVLAAILAFVYKSELLHLLESLEYQKTQHPVLVAGVLVLLQSIAAPLGFPGTPLTLLTGSLYGVWGGTIIASIGNIIGATLAFLLARYLFEDYTKKMIAKYPRINAYSERLKTRGLSTVLFLRLVPLFPFNAINFLLGVTPLPLRTYIVGSYFGMIPGTLLFVYLGGSLRNLSPLNITFGILGIMLLTLIGKYYEKRI